MRRFGFAPIIAALFLLTTVAGLSAGLALVLKGTDFTNKASEIPIMPPTIISQKCQDKPCCLISSPRCLMPEPADANWCPESNAEVLKRCPGVSVPPEPTPTPSPSPEIAWNDSCNNDVDCKVVGSPDGSVDCCGFRCQTVDYNDPAWVPVNSSWYDSQFNLKCKGVACPMMDCVERIDETRSVSAKCVFNHCQKIVTGTPVVTIYPPLPSPTSVPKPPPSDWPSITRSPEPSIVVPAENVVPVRTQGQPKPSFIKNFLNYFRMRLDKIFGRNLIW